MKDKKKKLNDKYGEVVPTEFEWIDPEKQKKIADKLANITKSKKKKDIE